VEIACPKVPSSLQRLISLTVCCCYRLRVIESKAPNLSSLCFSGHRLNFSHVETLQLKKLDICYPNFISDARGKLPSSMPNLETLVITSMREVFSLQDRVFFASDIYGLHCSYLV
jgi:hypothetical protein